MVLAPHLRMVIRPRKFWPHLLEKYDGIVNPAEFLQIYSTSILTAGGDEAVMAIYFPVTLTGMARSWLMNLPEGSLTSWQELCRQFTANLESAYSRPGNETDLHIIQQHLGESLCAFIQWFSQVHNIIPRISNASVVVAFRQGVRDEKMLKKLTTHDIQDVVELFSLADKCTRATEGCACHTPPAPEAGMGAKPDASAAAQGGVVVRRRRRPMIITSRWPELPPPQLLLQCTTLWCTAPVHNSTCHNTEEYREIKKLAEQYREQLKQQRGDGAPSRQQEGKQKIDPEEDKEDGMWFYVMLGGQKGPQGRIRPF
jgi:hypothetical protein